MKKTCLSAACLLFFCCLLTAQTRITHPLTDNRQNPLGIDDPAPRFSWQLASDARNLHQTAYQLRLYEIGRLRKLFWTSGKIKDGASVMIPYSGPALQSRTRYGWVVDVWDNSRTTPVHSDTAYFQTAFLHANDWQAKWIQPGFAEDETLRPCPLFRKTFTTQKKIISAFAYITAHGMYEAHINGKRVGDAYFTPGWTAYQKRVQYQVYDVTDLLQRGENAIAVTLANGWYRGVIGFSNHRNVYGSDIALLLQLEIQYSDGSKDKIVSDESWKSSTGAIRSAEIYNGEIQDTRLEKNGWDMPGYLDVGWSGVTILPNPVAALVATENEMVHRQESF
ncbi:MAG TPA: alpha-L-rhamnosidase N-terminal domain-containing protein, partial [Sediminibacterium sp.]|nr:alpha-L-rhamnosidase N-terminal domain-containing protein [Sediminibacterium sp.]